MVWMPSQDWHNVPLVYSHRSVTAEQQLRNMHTNVHDIVPDGTVTHGPVYSGAAVSLNDARREAACIARGKP